MFKFFNFFFFDLCYEIGNSDVGKSLLLDRYTSNSRFHGSRKGKKTFNNEHGSKSHDFFESSVMQVFIYAYFWF